MDVYSEYIKRWHCQGGAIVATVSAVPSARKNPKPAPYHHGDLRNALVAATLELIERDGADAFSLREVARAAGVSPRAPYQHFENKAALLAEIACEGYRLLGEVLRDGMKEARTGPDAIGRMLQAYVAFSLRHRSHFQVMFRPALYDKPNHPEVAEAGDRALAVLVQALTSSKRSGSGVAPDRLAVLAWSTAHGAASLLEDGALERRSEVQGCTPQELVTQLAATLTQLLRR